MPTAHIRLGAVMGGGAPVYAPTPSQLSTITTSATSQQMTPVAATGDFLRITARGGDICFAVNRSPVAVAGSGDVLIAGSTVDIGPLSAGDKVAVIDA